MVYTRHLVYDPRMYTPAMLLDVHARAHESLRRLMVLCSNLTADELRSTVQGFGFPTIYLQLEHTIGAELYWQTVLTTGYSEEATLPLLRDVADLERFRQQTSLTTRAYLERASETELSTRRIMISDPGETRLLRPADVIMRVVTHIFNHQGQILAMCRAIGKPNDEIDLDYPVD